jgi:hemolysin-activating ACP:hemolysin acyltransferase
MLMPDATTPTPDAQRPSRASFTLFRPDNPLIALGLAVNYLMTKPAFAQLKFGGWSRILTGQVNRGHYYFVLDDRKQVQGFLGWALANKDKAEAWVQDRAGVSFDDARDGDCIIFNAWAASAPGVNRVLLDAARQAMQGREMVYFKRYYKDGTTRPARLKVTDFIDGHLARNAVAA